LFEDHFVQNILQEHTRIALTIIKLATYMYWVVIIFLGKYNGEKYLNCSVICKLRG